VKKATSLRITGLGARVLVGFMLLALFFVFSAVPAQAVVRTYHLTASNGQAWPGGAVTTNSANNTDYSVPQNPTATQYGRTYLQTTTPAGSQTRWLYEFATTGTRLIGMAVLPSDYATAVTIAPNSTATFGYRNEGGTFTFDLVDVDGATGSFVVIGSYSTSTLAATATALSFTFNNSTPTVIQAGHRLGVRVSVTNPSSLRHRIHFNMNADPDRSFITVDELTDSTAPTTMLSTSPAAPDGDSGWFKTVPTITLSATDPEGSPTTTRYAWNSDPAPGTGTLYAGTFPALTGTNTLWYYSRDAIPNEETPHKSQLFNVDATIAAPTITTPTGADGAPPPTGIRGTVNYDATATDAGSGVNYVAFYYYAWNGSSYDAVGTQVGVNQTTPVSGSTYRVSWNTALVADGRYKLQAQLRDVAGNTSFSPAQYVRVDNTGPTVAITAPAAGATIRGTAYQIRGTASDAVISNWTLSISAVSPVSWTTLATGTSNVTDAVLNTFNTTTRSDGQYQFRLTATDALTNSSTITVSPVTIDNTGPAVVAAVAIAATNVDVLFGENLAPASVLPAYFTIPGLTVSGATLLPDNRTVRLTTSAQTVSAPYTVSVKLTTPSVTDVAGNLPQAPGTAGFLGYNPALDVTPPVQLTGLTAFSGHARNRLSWDASIAPDLAGYNVYRDTSAGGAFATKVNGALIAATTYDDTTYGAEGVVYYYKVTAVDTSANESVKSDVADTGMVLVNSNVGSGGGTLSSSSGEARIVVPAGALAGVTPIAITEQVAAPSSPPKVFVTPSYRFTPAGQLFTNPVQITLKYVPGAVDESTIKLLYFNGSAWVQVEGGSVVNQAADTVTGTVSHFTEFAAASLDVTAPTVSSVTPANGATGVPVNGFVTIVFSEPMDPSTLTNDKVQIRIGATPISAETVVLSSDRTRVYVYPDAMMDISTVYTVWISGAVTDLAGNPLGSASTTTFTTAATGITAHGGYTTAKNLCRNCHSVHGAATRAATGGGKLFPAATEKQVCYACHDGTGSSYNVKTADNVSPFSWDFRENPIGTTVMTSSHPVARAMTYSWVNATTTNTGVTMRCSNCHNAHNMTGTGARFLVNKKVDPSFSGAYVVNTGKDFCWTCHNTTAATSAGYISSASWNASTGSDHKTYYPTTDAGHNKTTGAVIMTNNQRVPSKQNIACKGCHSEHGSSNSKLIAEQVNGAAITFNSATVTGYNTTYNPLCFRCHSAAGLGGIYWPGTSVSTAAYTSSGHDVTAKNRSLTYSPPVPAVAQNLRVGVCKQCHNPHGTQFANYTLAFEEDLCYQCHAAAGPGRLLGPGSYSVQRQFTQGRAGGSTTVPDFTRAYNRAAAGAAVPLSRHPVLDAEQTKTFDTIKKNNNGTVTTVTATTGAIECLNCHNPHVNAGANPSSNYWKVLDADVQPGQVGYPTALRVYATTNTLTIGATTYSYNSGTAAPNADANPDKPLGTNPSPVGGHPYNPASGSADATADSIKFCLACHDNTVPTGTSPAVSMGAANPAGLPMNIATRYLATGNTGIAHGNGRGNYMNENDQRPRYPFQSSTYSNTPPARAYAAIQCTTCHDPHGSQNVYLLREYIVVDGINMNAGRTYLPGAAISIPAWPIDGNGRLYDDFYGKFCGTCHSGSGDWRDHKGGMGGTPTTSTRCDNEHRWSRYQGGTDGLHDNDVNRGDKRSW